MTGSVHNLGLEGSKVLLDSVNPSGLSPLRKENSSCDDGQTKGSSSPAKKSERNLDMKKIEKEMQEIMSPTPLEFHKVCVAKGCPAVALRYLNGYSYRSFATLEKISFVPC